MSKTVHGNCSGRHGAWFVALILGCAVLLVIGLSVSLVSAGPAQEKGQDETKEEKEKPTKFTNKDLRKGSGSSGSGESSAPDGEDGSQSGDGDDQQPGDQAGEAPEDPWDSVGVAVDSEGRGEAYWRQAMSEARAAVTTAKSEHQRLQNEMNRQQVDFTAIDDPAVHALVTDRIQELYGLLDEAKQAIADAEQAVSDLDEDARRSGALPGWLR